MSKSNLYSRDCYEAGSGQANFDPATERVAPFLILRSVQCGFTTQVAGTPPPVAQCGRKSILVETLTMWHTVKRTAEFRGCRHVDGFAMLPNGSTRSCSRPLCAKEGCPGRLNCSLAPNKSFPRGSAYSSTLQPIIISYCG